MFKLLKQSENGLEKASNLFRLSSGQGNDESMYQYGLLLLKGEGVDKDLND